MAARLESNHIPPPESHPSFAAGTLSTDARPKLFNDVVTKLAGNPAKAPSEAARINNQSSMAGSNRGISMPESSAAKGPSSDKIGLPNLTIEGKSTVSTPATSKEVKAETKEANAETKKVNAETKEVNAETKEANAETKKANAETKAAKAEAKAAKVELKEEREEDKAKDGKKGGHETHDKPEKEKKERDDDKDKDPRDESSKDKDPALDKGHAQDSKMSQGHKVQGDGSHSSLSSSQVDVVGKEILDAFKRNDNFSLMKQLKGLSDDDLRSAFQQTKDALNEKLGGPFIKIGVDDNKIHLYFKQMDIAMPYSSATDKSLDLSSKTLRENVLNRLEYKGAETQNQKEWNQALGNMSNAQLALMDGITRQDGTALRSAINAIHDPEELDKNLQAIQSFMASRGNPAFMSVVWSSDDKRVTIHNGTTLFSGSVQSDDSSN